MMLHFILLFASQLVEDGKEDNYQDAVGDDIVWHTNPPIDKVCMTHNKGKKEQGGQNADVRPDSCRVIFQTYHGEQSSKDANGTPYTADGIIFLPFCHAECEITQQTGEQDSDNGEKNIWFHGISVLMWLVTQAVLK